MARFVLWECLQYIAVKPPSGVLAIVQIIDFEYLPEVQCFEVAETKMWFMKLASVFVSVQLVKGSQKH